jgi:hypothetical protein
MPGNSAGSRGTGQASKSPVAHARLRRIQSGAYEIIADSESVATVTRVGPVWELAWIGSLVSDSFESLHHAREWMRWRFRPSTPCG